MNKHTSGPWNVGGKECSEVFDANGNQVAFCVHLRVGKPERSVVEAAANAYLTAAAPELLEALEMGVKDTLDYIQRNNLSGAENNHWIVLARAAIAKATKDV